MKKIIIRADGNKAIAMGHIMRCLSVACAIRAAGGEAVFVTAGSETRELIESRGFSNVVLGSRYDCLEEELPALVRVLDGQKPSCLLLDTYFVTQHYLDTVSKVCPVAYMDDMDSCFDGLAMLINYNINASRAVYEELYRDRGFRLPKKLLTGCSYAPLRDEFRAGYPERYREEKAVLSVLISTGGGDRYGVASALCREIIRIHEAAQEGADHGAAVHEGAGHGAAVCEGADHGAAVHEGADHDAGLKHLHFNVVCGPMYEDGGELERLVSGREEFTLLKGVSDMAGLMKSCDLAVSATGSTMYELCAMGLPMVCFYFADNQRFMAEYFHKNTGVVCCGDASADKSGVVRRIIGELERLTYPAIRKKLSAELAGLVDGRGAERIAGALSDLI